MFHSVCHRISVLLHSCFGVRIVVVSAVPIGEKRAWGCHNFVQFSRLNSVVCPPTSLPRPFANSQGQQTVNKTIIFVATLQIMK